MEKIIEFGIEEEELKKYLEECLKEKNINYEIKIQEKWTQDYVGVSQYYQLYSLYVDSNKLGIVKEIIKDWENGTIIDEDVEELKNAEDEEQNNRFKIFTKKNFLKYYWAVLIIIAILIIIGIKFTV